MARVLDASDWVVNIWTLFLGATEKNGRLKAKVQSAIIIVPLFFIRCEKNTRFQTQAAAQERCVLSSLRPKLSRLPMLLDSLDPFHLFRSSPRENHRALH